ncbi:hypothetical protein GYN07_18000 [Rhizobium leguminosarum bv. viciae 248]|nr:hypothetical protein [Rhizobium leguminosarum]MCA2409286.1 hypothetical protein [Rhizobium leguminosarum]QHW22799.1 hypothetical protein GYN07_18000 [Rhizobium leguminosarum bv. viciae 248]
MGELDGVLRKHADAAAGGDHLLQFSMLEQELDWAELAALQPGRDEIVES